MRLLGITVSSLEEISRPPPQGTSKPPAAVTAQRQNPAKRVSSTIIPDPDADQAVRPEVRKKRGSKMSTAVKDAQDHHSIGGLKGVFRE